MTVDQRLDALHATVDRILAILEAQPIRTSAPQQASGAIADAADLDSQYGDEEIKKMPSAKYWDGRDFKGERMSSLPSDFLLAFANYKDACAYMTRKNNEPEKIKYADYDEKSARQARGWAARNAGRVAKPVDAFDDGVPF